MLRQFASKYIWWKSPDEAAELPGRVIAQVMDMGDYADVLALAAQLGDDVLRDVLIHAKVGQFSARSWHDWHCRLDLAEIDEVPPLPVRKLA